MINKITKQRRIERIKELINPQPPQPENIEVFRIVEETNDLPREKQLFTWNGKTISRQEAKAIPKKVGIFIVRGYRPEHLSKVDQNRL